jgi:hypothetical protein
MLFNNENTGG